MAGFGKRGKVIAAFVLGTIAGATASAQAGLAVLAGGIGDKTVTASQADTQEHFPGAALHYMVEDDAAPAPGVTGTAPLPAAPAGVSLIGDAGVTAVTAARPFAFNGAPADRSRALECLTAAIYYEAASESDDGQRAVAQVVLNRVRHRAFPASVCGVVYQGSERRTGCQFSFSCDGAMARRPSAGGWARARGHAAAALSGSVFAPAGLATHYHTYVVTPRWNRSLVMTTAIGAHFFHRWKGYWGTGAGFTQRHAGAEPFPGPKPRSWTPDAPTSLAAAPPDRFAPLPVERVAPRAIAVAAAPVTEESQIQEKYRDSGEWIAR